MPEHLNAATEGSINMPIVTGGIRAPGSEPRLFVNAGAPADGTTGAGECFPGEVLVDQTNGVAYVNRGTQASPVWCPLRGIWENAGAPSGSTRQNQAQKGDLLVDRTNAKLYINTGRSASPTWTVVGTQT